MAQEIKAGVNASTPEQLLKRIGLKVFRPGQREAVQAALDGRDSLVVMPTGGGKSLCYQLPALANIGLVIVVSPLISLMADQQRRMLESGIAATTLNSGMEESHNIQALREILDGSARLVLVAPERFASAAFRDVLRQKKIGLFVVDEAHCIAEWGHDFRPDYLRLRDIITALDGTGENGRPTIMATTATATPRVASEIAIRLGLQNWVSVRSGFDRPNLTFDVVHVEGKGALLRKRIALLHVLSKPDASPAIVYCGTRKATEDVTGLLIAEGIPAVSYHAGMTPEERQRSQTAFMDGHVGVIVATNAFGMGVDKANVHTVVHWALPTSLESYYQEAGRAGRDGEPARALLIASRMDLGRLISFIKEREMTVEDVRSYVANLRQRARMAAEFFADEDMEVPYDTNVSTVAVMVSHEELDDRQRILLSVAERSGAVELRPGGHDGVLVRLTGKGSPGMAQSAIQAAENRSWESYRSIERYSSNGDFCRRRQILDHFGDNEPVRPSGRCCDVCAPDETLLLAMQETPASRARVNNNTVSADKRSKRDPTFEVTNGESEKPVDEKEFEALRTWRWERSNGNPAYTVTTDTVLREVLRRRPLNISELREIKGIGPSFCEKHGEALLTKMKEFAI
jgi:RecQ family ATP-dependent DNA helicase